MKVTCRDIKVIRYVFLPKGFNLQTMLQPPKNQTAEVLYELLTNESINRRSILINTGILNLTARIADLRNKHGIVVKCQMIKTENKHNRSISFGKWSIDKNISVVDVYNKINV